MARVGVVGACGRMGTVICEAVKADPTLELVAQVGSGDPLDVLTQARTQVAVDVTNGSAARVNLPWLAEHGINAVVGTTGLTDDDVQGLQNVFVANEVRCFLVPNTSVGAVLMMRFAEQAAQYFEGVEIIELHHAQKKDAPSGTAKITASKISAARTDPWAPDLTEIESVSGARGGEAAPGIRVHSVRLPGLLAHQEVIFGAVGQTLTLRHDSYDRQSFMPGILTAIKKIGNLSPGVTSGLDAVL